MGNDTRNGPRSSRVLGGKGNTAIPEISLIRRAALQRAFAA